MSDFSEKGQETVKKAGGSCCGCCCGCGLIVFILVSALVSFVACSIIQFVKTNNDDDSGGDSCGGPAVIVKADPAQVKVAGFTAEQLGNAATIMIAGVDFGGLSTRDQAIAIMTAIQESSLRNLHYGDLDSLGLFQQRAGWGSVEQRTDPYESSILFYRALAQISDRDTMAPTVAAQAVQRSAYPDAYAKWWGDAINILDTLAANSSDISAVCQADSSRMGDVHEGVAMSGWARPAAGPITSGFGQRKDPISGVITLHTGTDLGGGGRGKPIFAAYPGTVTTVGFDKSGNGTIIIDHGTINGQKIETRYLHEDNPGLMVHVGQQVVAGQQIGQVGSSGHATGPHCHYEVRINGQPINAVPFMAARGIDLNATG